MTATQANYRSITKYQLVIMDEDHFISLIFTRWASRRLPSAALLREKHNLL